MTRERDLRISLSFAFFLHLGFSSCSGSGTRGRAGTQEPAHGPCGAGAHGAHSRAWHLLHPPPAGPGSGLATAVRLHQCRRARSLP